MNKPWVQMIDPNKRILEIGPLATPVIPKNTELNNIYYADIRSTEEIKNLYKSDSNVNNDAIVFIDYVIKDSYSKDLKDVEQFDYILMIHVLEHIPQLIDFFLDIVNILKPGGKLCLTIPDKRYCFDHYRQPTSFAECYDIYSRRVNNNPLRVLDFLSSWTINDPNFWWENNANFEHLMSTASGRQPIKVLNDYKSAINGEYFDVHFSVFTPETFLMLIFFLTKYNLFPFKIIKFFGTEIDSFEFNVVLEKCPVLLANSDEKNKACEKILTFLSGNSDNVRQCIFVSRLIKKYLRLISRVVKNA